MDLLRGSEEYNYVSTTFHLTMHKPRASVVKIQRVQNAILWEFYMVYVRNVELLVELFATDEIICVEELWWGGMSCRMVADELFGGVACNVG